MPDLDNSVSGDTTSVFALHPINKKAKRTNPRIFAVNFFGTLKNRRERHMYVAIWFYIATIVAVAVLHIVNSIEIPVSFLQSYPVYAGIQDALVQK